MQDNASTQAARYWANLLSNQLVGKTIVEVRYTSVNTARMSDWAEQGIELVLNDGTVLVPVADNAASAPGALTAWVGTSEITTPTLALQSEHGAFTE